MNGVLQAFVTGRDAELMWNREQRIVGYSFIELPVPPKRYRIFRGLHCAQMQARENIALALAPWLETPRLP